MDLGHSKWRWDGLFLLVSKSIYAKKMKNKKECSYHSMDLSWHALNSMLQVKIPITLKNKDFATCGFQKMFQTHPPKPAEAKPSFRNVSLPLQNYSCFSPLTSGLEFWPQIYSLWQAMDWGLLSKILASMKWAEPRMLKGQLSRVPWPGNSKRIFSKYRVATLKHWNGTWKGH